MNTKKNKSKKYPGLKPGSFEYKKSCYLNHMYGITLNDYNKMFKNQEGCCAICGKHQTETEKRFHIDHCHSTNKVRGLLCFSCNNAIGQLNDDPAILRKAIEYLEN